MSEVKTERGKKQDKQILSRNGELCNQHTLSRSSGWATSRPMGSPGRTPIRSQKQLKG